MPLSKMPRVGLWLSRTDPYWIQIDEAIHFRGQKLPIELMPLVSLLDSSQFSPADEADLVEDILSYSLSALIATHLPNSTLKRLLNAGLPIVLLTLSDIVHSRLVTFEEYYEAGVIASRFVTQRLHGAGHVVVCGGLVPQVGEGGQQRITAIRDVFQPEPQLTWQHIPTPWAYEKAYPLIYNALQQMSRPPDALLGLSDALGLAARDAAAALNLLTDQTVVVGINGDPLALAAIAEGRLTGTIDTDTAQFGGAAVDAAFALLNHQPTSSTLSIQASLVTIDNIQERALKKLIAIADIPSRLVGVNHRAEQLRLSQLELLVSINQRLGGLLERELLLNEAAQLLRKHYHYNEINIYAWDSSSQLLKCEFPELQTSKSAAFSGLVGQVALSGTPIFIPDVFQSLQYVPDADHPQTRSRAILPIRHHQSVIGVLDLHSTSAMQHMRHELPGLQLIADQLGIAGQNVRLYEEANQARLAAEKADRLKTLLLANVSHELRSPLDLILGYSQILLGETSDLPDNLRIDVEQIYQSGEQLTRLISDLLDMSRLDIDNLNIEPDFIDTGRFLEEVFQGMAKNNRQPEVTWAREFAEGLPMIEADPVRLRQILHNLMGNARKFTPSGQITLGAEVEPPHLHIWVQDTGSGISPEHQSRIFEPFFSVRQQGQHEGGIGLGLSITRQLVALHNGWISLESQVGRGSTFHLYLPLPGLTGSIMSHDDTSADPVILLISHQSVIPEAVSHLSERLGYRIETVSSISQFIKTRRPALIAWDMHMAQQNDWDIIANLRQQPSLCRQPFMVFHSHTGVTGLTNFLVKPINQNTLFDMLESLRPTTSAVNPLLIVDDDPQSRSYYSRLLESAFPGMRIMTAADGQAALELMADIIPSLVILDLMMPKVDGFAVLEVMRQTPHLQGVSVLVMSGKLLTVEDARRLDFARVVFQSKSTLSDEELASELRRLLRDGERLPQPTSAIVKRALAYLHQHYAVTLTRQQIAQAVGVSERYLSEIFKHEIGLSPWEVLNRFRVQRACDLLRQSSVSITEIATRVGFDDSSYFGRVFHQQMGTSPSRYRQTH